MKWKSFMQPPIIILLGMEENICCKYEYSLVQKKNIPIFQTLPVAKPYFYGNDYFHAAKVLNSVMPSYVMGDWKNLKPLFRNSDNLSTHNLRSNSLSKPSFSSLYRLSINPISLSFTRSCSKLPWRECTQSRTQWCLQSLVLFLVYWCAVAQMPCQWFSKGSFLARH